MRTFAVAMTAMVLISILAATMALDDTLTQNLPMINVTALKEQVPTERIASAVSSISFETLRKNGTYRPNSLSRTIPGLHIPDYGASMTSTVYLRGLGSRMDNPVMGLYIDGIPVIDKNAYDFDWEGLNGVTMLGGPQGTLYGRNSMGGVLSLSTISPLEDSKPTVRLEYGTANTFRAGISFTAGSHAFSATFRHTDGFFMNVYKNRLTDPYDGLSFRWKWERHVTERTTLTNILQANLSKEGGFAYGLWQDSVLHPVSYNDEGSYRRLSVIEGFKLHRCGDEFKTDVAGSLQLLSDDMHMDQDYTPKSVFTLQQKQLSGAGTLEFTLCRADAYALWQPQTGLFAFYRLNSMSAPVTFKRDGIETLILNNANSHIPEDIGYLAISDTRMPVNSDFLIDTWNTALFHESVFDLDRWTLTAGIRLDYEGGTMDYDCMARLHYRFEPVMTADRELSVPYKGTVSHRHFEVIPKLSALFRVNSETALYATLSKGYRAGGFNTQIFSDILQNITMNAVMKDLGVHLDRKFVSVTAGNTEYDPETAWNMELGTRFNHGPFRAQASVYCMNVSGQQLTVFPPGMSTGRMMTNAGRSRSIGLETIMSWNPERFRSHVSWSWCDARFISYNDGNADYSGNRLPYVPEHTLDAGIGYSFRLGSRTLDIDAGLNGAGPYSWNEAGTQKEPFRLKVSGRIALVLGDTEIYVRGENLTGTQERSFYFKSVGKEFFASGKPRTIMTGITFKL
jgi:outer membrane receptor protein involved in Fe transport